MAGHLDPTGLATSEHTESVANQSRPQIEFDAEASAAGE